MVALERLSPLERAAFLLHDVFGMRFDELSRALDRDPAACRKLASWARRHIHAARPRFAVPREKGLELAAAFYQASRRGDLSALGALLREDVVSYADGGGKVPTTLVPTVGSDAVLALFRALARRFAKAPSQFVRMAMIDGLPGFVTIEAGGVVQTTALQVDHGEVAAIYVTRNPEKLRHLATR